MIQKLISKLLWKYPIILENVYKQGDYKGRALALPNGSFVSRIEEFDYQYSLVSTHNMAFSTNIHSGELKYVTVVKPPFFAGLFLSIMLCLFGEKIKPFALKRPDLSNLTTQLYFINGEKAEIIKFEETKVKVKSRYGNSEHNLDGTEVSGKEWYDLFVKIRI